MIFLTLMTEFVKKAKEIIKDGMNLETRKQAIFRICDEKQAQI